MYKAKLKVSDYILLLNAGKLSLFLAMFPSFSQSCLTTADQQHILPLFGIHKQVSLDCLPLAVFEVQRKLSRAKYARWGSYVWEGKELYHTNDFLMNLCIYSCETTKNVKLLHCLWKKLQEEIEDKSLWKIRSDILPFWRRTMNLRYLQ